MRARWMVLVVAVSSPASGDVRSDGPDAAWANESRSPRPYGRSADALWSMCPEPDQALTEAARRLAGTGAAAEDLATVLHAAGDPHVAPRALLLEGRLSASGIRERVRAWLDATPAVGRRRCGFASVSTSSGSRFAAVTLDALADLAPVPVRVAPGTWIAIDALVQVPARGVKVVVQSPDGEVRGVPTSFFQGQAKARANVDRRGAWVFQVLIVDETGPRPALEATVFAGVEPFAGPSDAVSRVPAGADPAAEVFARLTSARAERGLSALARDPRLDAVAKQHAERMRQRGRLGHDVGDGDPSERVRAAAVDAAAVGENVAHAGDAALAHHALWSSPSHRANLLDRSFDRVGVGVSADPDGTLWVAQIFVRRR